MSWALVADWLFLAGGIVAGALLACGAWLCVDEAVRRSLAAQPPKEAVPAPVPEDEDEEASKQTVARLVAPRCAAAQDEYA